MENVRINPPAEPSEPIVNECPAITPPRKTRGRPRLSVRWPEGEFSFLSLEGNNVLSASSLRKKIRAELKTGGLLKVGVLKTAFGRPQNLYKKK